MKILFSKQMAFVYGGLSICALISFIVIMNIATNYDGLILPISVIPIKPIIYTVHPLFFFSIIFGGWAILCHWRMNKSTVSVIFAIGILLTGVFEGYWALLRKGVLGPPTQLTDVVIYSGKVRNYDLGHGVTIAQTLCIPNKGAPSMYYLIDVYEGTKIYEQNGTSQEKLQVGLGALQPGQVVDIKGIHFVSDPEFKEFFSSKYPLRLSLEYLIGAEEITIHKGETVPVKNVDCYGFISAP
jgi:hypothetical protein